MIETEFETLKGKTFTSIVLDKLRGKMTFICDNGDEYTLTSLDNELNRIEDFSGSLASLTGSPIIQAGAYPKPSSYNKFFPAEKPWTCYSLATKEGDMMMWVYGTEHKLYLDEYVQLSLI